MIRSFWRYINRLLKGGEKMKKIFSGLVLVLSVFAVLGTGNSVYAKEQGLSVHHDWRVIRLTGGQVTGISGTTLTVIKNGKTYSAVTGTGTKFRRRFWGLTSIDQISVGDTVNIWGRIDRDDSLNIKATIVQDVSIQEKNDSFAGTVSSVTGNGFVLLSEHRGTVTVTVDANTKITGKSGNQIALSDIQTGNSVVLDGLYDRTLQTVTFVTFVKDLSL